MRISEIIRQDIQKSHGDKSEDWLSDIYGRIEKYAELWELSQLAFMETDTDCPLFSCDSAVHGACIFKICLTEPEFETGVNCLRVYDGTAYVKLYAYDLTDYVVLLERVTPGNQMWDVEDFRERARLFAEIVKDLPILWDGYGKFPTYRMQMEDLRITLIDLGDREKALFYLDEALRIYDELKQNYNRKYMLHGDLHQYNILLNSKGGYTIIDPKGVVDDPVMETARYLMNESPCGAEKIREIISIISSIIGIPKEDITKSMFIDAALGQCWNLDKPFSNQSDFAEQMREVLEICGFAYGLL